MNFKLITGDLNAKGLKEVDLNVLRQDADLYTTLLFQPEGELDYDTDFLKIKDANTAEGKFKSFFEIALEKNVELAITPEYSCPWNVINSIIESNILPNENNLWIIGCESIKAKELNNLINSKNQIKWIVDQDKIDANINNSKFFDPVCYILRARTHQDNALQTVIVIQFKTHPLGGDGLEWERDNFIKGSEIYVLQNNDNSTRLITLICSDTLNPNWQVQTKLPQFTNHPYLIIHIQLNQAPANSVYAKYRAYTYERLPANKEVICLNWSNNVVLDNKQFSKYGGSAIYQKNAKETELNLSDSRLNTNHKNGLYYTRWPEKRSNVFFFNYKEHLYLFRNTKPSQNDALPSVQKRTGPELITTYIWNNAWLESNDINSGFINLCLELENNITYETLFNLYSISPIDVERLIYLSIGKAINKNWHHPFENSFFSIKDDEINNRITFTQNPCPVSHKAKKDSVMLYTVFEYSIIIEPKNLPPSIQDLKGNCQINYRLGEFTSELNLNLYPRNGSGIPASGAYLGHSTEKDAQLILAKMSELLENGQFGKRTVVWYLDHNMKIQNKYNPEKPRINENTLKSKRSISSNKSK